MNNNKIMNVTYPIFFTKVLIENVTSRFNFACDDCVSCSAYASKTYIIIAFNIIEDNILKKSRRFYIFRDMNMFTGKDEHACQCCA